MAISVIGGYEVEFEWGDNPSATVPYKVIGSEDENAIRTALVAAAASTYNGMLRSSYTTTHVGGGVWECSVRYDNQGSSDVSQASSTAASENSDSVQWDNQAQMYNLKVSKETIKKYGPSGVLEANLPNYQKAIGWDGENVQGVDIARGAFTFQLTRKMTDDEVDEDFMRLLSRKSFHVNSDAFWIWQAGEVLFLGAQGSRTGGGVIAEEGDDDDILSGYDDVTGISATNSNNGKIYIKVTRSGGYTDAYLYKKSTMTAGNLVAHTYLGNTGQTLDLIADNSSGIGGTVKMGATYVQDTTSIIVTFPLPWTITYRFAVEENSATPGSGEEGDLEIAVKLGADANDQYIVKKGWEYLWYQFEDFTTGTAPNLVKAKRPKYAFIEKVYDEIAFADLKLGDSPFKESVGS